jgi:hypothetical protein
VRVLAPLREGDQRRLLASNARTEGWSVNALKERVRRIQKPHPGGRPSQPALLRAVVRIHRVVEAKAGDAAQLRESAREPDPGARGADREEDPALPRRPGRP